MSRFRAVWALTALLAFALPGASASAAAPPVGVSMQIDRAEGFAASSEVAVRPGWVIDTFHSSGSTVQVFGRSGSTVSFGGARASGRAGSATFSMSSPVGAGSKATIAPAGQLGSAVGALIALGVNPRVALAQFGGLDTLGGATPATDVALASGSLGRVMSPMVAVSTSVPWDVQCATVSTENGRVQGYGCSTAYVVWASGTNWYLANKYKFTAQSTSTSLFPLRLMQVGWRLSWATGNVIFDEDPTTARTVGSCATVTVGSSGEFVSRRLQHLDLGPDLPKHDQCLGSPDLAPVGFDLDRGGIRQRVRGRDRHPGDAQSERGVRGPHQHLYDRLELRARLLDGRDAATGKPPRGVRG